MQRWRLAPPRSVSDRAGAALSDIIDAIGRQDFGQRVIQQINAVLPVGSWSAYRIGAASRPRLYHSASLNRPDTTRDCWRAYLSGPHLSDRTLCVDASRDGDVPEICRISADEIPSTQHKERIYRRFGMVERLSVVEPAADGSLLAINLYRHAGQSSFSDRELAGFEYLAHGLIASVKRTILFETARHETATGVQPAVARLREILQRNRPDLSARELDVCARLLRGMSHDGIAADLGLGMPTVKTYRNRAFARLGIHFRSELFSFYLGLDRE